jgi:hypothetical protein
VRGPTASELLAVWERCAARTPAERALELLPLASPEDGNGDLGALSVGERDARLLDLRERAFGPALAAAARCGRCEELVEFSVRAEELRLNGSQPQAPLSCSADGYELRFRVPTAGDVAVASREPNAGRARRQLLERCVLEARRDGVDVQVDALPAPVTDALAARMAAADPRADVELALACPACGHEWTAAFDAAAFLWSELDAWTRRTLHDVHTLATAYGWTEAEVLALGRRRHVYLELVGG